MFEKLFSDIFKMVFGGKGTTFFLNKESEFKRKISERRFILKKMTFCQIFVYLPPELKTNKNENLL